MEDHIGIFKTTESRGVWERIFETQDEDIIDEKMTELTKVPKVARDDLYIVLPCDKADGRFLAIKPEYDEDVLATAF